MKPIKKPNVKGPRFRERRMSVLTKDTLKKFKKKYPEYGDLSLAQFKEIVKVFNNNITEGVIENRNGIELPEGLGYIFMGTCPTPKKKNVDYNKSIKYGVETTYRNWDSDNNLLKIFYTNYKSKYSFQNKQVWAFKAVKHFRSRASAAYKEDWTKYIRVDPTSKISAMFKRQRKREYMENRKPDIPKGYDEFKL